MSKGTLHFVWGQLLRKQTVMWLKAFKYLGKSFSVNSYMTSEQSSWLQLAELSSFAKCQLTTIGIYLDSMAVTSFMTQGASLSFLFDSRWEILQHTFEMSSQPNHSRIIASILHKKLPWSNAFWPTYVAGWSWHIVDTVCFTCYSSGPKGVSPGQKALFHGSFLHFLTFSWSDMIW